MHKQRQVRSARSNCKSTAAQLLATLHKCEVM
jgi:hypothetical protein